MMIVKIYIFLIVLFTPFNLSGQYIKENNSLLEKAHETKINLEEFTVSENKLFKIKIFSVGDRAMVNRTHHWFLQVLDAENNFVNFANIKVSGSLSGQSEIDFNFMDPVNKLCTEGKYIIGFVKVKEAGVYQLRVEINNLEGQRDIGSYEIEIPDSQI